MKKKRRRMTAKQRKYFGKRATRRSARRTTRKRRATTRRRATSEAATMPRHRAKARRRTTRRAARRSTRRGYRGSRRGFSLGLGGFAPPNALMAVGASVVGVIVGEYAIGSAFLQDWQVGWRRVAALAGLGVGVWMLGKKVNRPIAGGVSSGLLMSAGLSAVAIIRAGKQQMGPPAPGVTGLGELDEVSALLEASDTNEGLGDLQDDLIAAAQNQVY